MTATPEQIAKRLVEIHDGEDHAWHYDYQGCFFCSAGLGWNNYADPDPGGVHVDPEQPHEHDCPFGMALAWKAEQELMAGLRRQALSRLAEGLDIPPEIIDSSYHYNHWTGRDT